MNTYTVTSFGDAYEDDDDDDLSMVVFLRG